MTTNKLWKTLTIALTVSLYLGLSSLTAQAVEEIEYAYPDISVWTTERDAEGKLKNPLVKLAGPLFEKAGIPWHPQDYPAKRMFANLRDGTSKFSMLVNAESILQGCCLVSKDPVALVEIRVFHKKDTPPITKREDLNGKSVITIRGYSYAGTLKYIQDEKNAVDNYPAPSHHAAFSMFDSGRADYIIDYAFPAAEVLEQQPIEDITYSTLKQTNVYLILHKDYPDAENVMARLEKIAKTLDKEEFLTSPSVK
ncbi:transporter substrate-binding domain-containing protein [Terasakiella sp. A23]|uniref:substrate-binding periplasmic protein n=1 Tax=Terasakiella sp. FCG-A23 TaxID=3080561 RepID=UPI00295444E1|nr:transporter substrate-binding domain-containing protein [Terasakiella sp. A23]MDV7338435.1 transporter substrate-binding domain-containing protein [Terasakiella sp. A23]